VKKPIDEQLQTCCRRLPAAQQQQLLDFAEFLLARVEPAMQPVDQVRQNIPRPAEESVLNAVKRLRASFPMLNEAILLHPVSALVTAHVTKGRNAQAVIDDLEQLFEDSHKHWLQSHG